MSVFCKTAKDVLNYGKKHHAVMVDLRFIDLPGIWQHTTIPFKRLQESSFKEGFGFDGSSVRGFQSIEQSDMLIVPDPKTAKMDPFTKDETLVLICDIVDPQTGKAYEKCPRTIAKKAEAHLKKLGIADTVYFGPEAEFFVLDDVRYNSTPDESFFSIDSDEAHWNTGSDEGPNLGHKVRYKGGYFPVMPVDTLMDFRTDVCNVLTELGYEVEVSHHEVATAGQCEIDVKYGTLTETADQIMWFKYVVKNMALRYGKTATFMPKPIYGDNGSGMHCHQSLWKKKKPLFAGKEYAGLSPMALSYIEGVLKHAKSLCAFTNASVNSYRRLVPGYEAPVNLAYSARNRSAAIRIPQLSNAPQAKRIEVRFPDASGNPYLIFSALLMAGLEGIQAARKIPAPVEKNIFAMGDKERSKIATVPGSLSESLTGLKKDHAYLLEGDVFPKSVIDVWCELKQVHEIDPVRLRTTPLEFELYYDV